MRYLHYVSELAARVILLPLYFLSGFIARDKNLWVFGSWGGDRFADNSAAFFLYCSKHLDDRIRLVWVSSESRIVEHLRAAGHEAHRRWSLAGMLACARAGFHFFDCFPKDTNFWVSRGAVRVNLWSGVPLKVFERDIDNPRSRYHRLFHGSLPERWFLSAMMPWHVVRPDLIIATSSETAAITRRAFAVPDDRLVVTGFPRNDALLEAAAPEHAEALPGPFRAALAASRKIFLYLPTFRDSGASYAGIDWRRLNQLMADRDAIFFYKFHPVARPRDTAEGLSNVCELPQDIDVYPLLPSVDALISDYSSIIFDFMLLDRPIVYYVPDLEAFVSGSRALNWHPEELAVGPVCKDFPALLQALDKLARGVAVHGPQSKASVLPRLHTHLQGRASARVLDVVDRRYFGGSLTRDDRSAAFGKEAEPAARRI
jgi:CDP-glycerol glycerophosphotransferase (TagB/SpsB family)